MTPENRRPAVEFDFERESSQLLHDLDNAERSNWPGIRGRMIAAFGRKCAAQAWKEAADKLNASFDVSRNVRNHLSDLATSFRMKADELERKP